MITTGLFAGTGVELSMVAADARTFMRDVHSLHALSVHSTTKYL